MIKLSTKQLEAFDGIMHFLFNSDKLFYVFSGVAGSGKTSIISMITNELDKVSRTYRVLALTGRAVSVIKNYCGDARNVSTIHSFIYRPRFDNAGNMVGYDKLTLQELGHYDFLLVDEASMLDQKLMKDLTSYNIPILFVGDSEQLPSFGDDFNIMDHHDIHLTEIHRVAEGNPIISLSRDIRENGKITKNMLYKHVDGSHLKFIDKKNFNTSYITSNHHDIVVTGTNRKRIMVNNMYRSLLSDWDIAPRMGEPIMCLRNTWFPEMLDYMYNGEIYIPTEITQKDGEITKYLLESNDSNKTFEVKIEECAWDGSCEKKAFEQDGNTFTYSYAATCHKMQGSQFNNICYYREDVSGFCDQRKFDYTAITRAKENLTVVL